LVPLETEEPDDAGQREPLHHECRENDAERQEDDQRAIRKRRPGVGAQRDRKRRCEGDGASHARPGDERDELPRRGRIALTKARRHPPGYVSDGWPVDDPDENDHRRDECRVAHELLPGPAVEILEYRPQLEPDEAEEQRVQEEVENRPETGSLQPCLAGRQLGCVPAHVDAGRDDRQHPGRADR
jgi:hypothetical protein